MTGSVSWIWDWSRRKTASISRDPIYQETIIWALTQNARESIPSALPGRKRADGEKILMNPLMESFQIHWRNHSQMIKESGCHETAPHLALLSFMRRLLNSGVENLDRESATGRGRADICAKYKGVSYPAEIMTMSSGGFTGRKREEALIQPRGYMDTLGAKEGWLMVFDNNPEKQWEEKINYTVEKSPNSAIHVFGC